MSRPRPPLHDPYGLLRPPPPLDTPSSIYSAPSNSLGSTVSLPLPSASPGRRNRQRGISPSRTQQGEEYDDQPYLTNVVRHHGQVTLVPPVNQGRTRKIRRRRNPDAAASTTSLVEPGARPGPSRLDGEPSPHRSPRRPRQGSETRAVSSLDIHPSSYPDYPPPSFDEVLALDRQASSLNVPTRPPAQEPTQPESSAPPLSSPATVLSPDSPRAPTIATTPWEEDRRLGLSLEERVRRELERNLISGVAESSPRLTIETSSSLPPDDIPPAPSSGTPTSAASNFLTPQNLTPSPLGVSLPLLTRASPKVDASAPRSASPPAVPLKSPALSLPPAPDANQSTRAEDLTASNAASAESHGAGPLDQLDQASSTCASSHEQAAIPQPAAQTISQGSPLKKSTTLASLLFTTRLNLDGPPELESSATRTTGQPSDHDHAKDAPPTPNNSKGKLKEVINESSAIAPMALERTTTPQAPSPRKVLTKSRPLSELPTAVNGTSLLLQPPVPRRPPPPKPPSLANLNAEIAPSTPPLPSPTANPFQGGTLPTALRRPPPPPPPRPRPRSIGAGVAARVSAYEAILANAPKVPPPIPPRPRERQQASSSESKSEATQEHKEGPADANAGGVGQTADHGTHIANLPKPRPISLPIPEPGPSRIRPVGGSRPLSIPLASSAPSPSPERAKRDPSPERPKSPTKQAQALVPARIGPDGKLEIIPDAEVIWLDEAHADPKDVDGYSNIRPEYPDTRAVDEQRHVATTAPAETVAGPSTRRAPVPPPRIPAAISPNTEPDHMPVEHITTNPFSPPSDFTPFASPPIPIAGQPTATSHPASSPRLADDFEYTDLDLLISRLEENEAAHQGANYEQLLTVGEVLGPAVPRTRAELDLNVGLVEIQRRRVMKDGRVKLKLSLMGVSVDKCGICLAQFKNNDSAVLLPCLHSYHTNCIMSWLVRQDVPACPHCRTPV